MALAMVVALALAMALALALALAVALALAMALNRFEIIYKFIWIFLECLKIHRMLSRVRWVS